MNAVAMYVDSFLVLCSKYRMTYDQNDVFCYKINTSVQRIKLAFNQYKYVCLSLKSKTYNVVVFT